MKTISMLMLFIASCFTGLFAQIKDAVSYPDAQDITFEYEMPFYDTCVSPSNIVNAVVYTRSNAIAYLEFKSELPIERVSVYDVSTGNWFGDFTIDKGQLILNELETENSYELFVTNSCGDESLIAVVDTKIEKKSPLPISTTLFSELTYYVNDPSPAPLNDFLANNQKVSYFERLSYFQQHLLQGQPFEEFPVEGRFPELERTSSRSTTCNCTFVINTVEFAAPGTQVLAIQNSTTRQGNITHSLTASGSDGDLWEDLGDGKYYWIRSSKGPAKNHHLESKGDWAGGGEEFWTENDLDQNNTGISANYAMLYYSFNCTNYGNVPAECSCIHKPINLDWRYDTNVSAWANKGGGIGEKYAAAAAQDVAVVTYQELGGTGVGGTAPGIEILGTGTVAAEAECDKSVSFLFWATAAEVAANIAIIVAAAEGAFPLTPEQIITLGNSLAQLISIPPITTEGCGSEANTSNMLTAGNTTNTKFLKPNVPIRMICSSFSNLGVWGKRGWLSKADIKSSFKISGYIKGGLIGHDEDYCCTNNVGNWVAASREDPNRKTEFLQLVGTHLLGAFTGLPTYPSGAILIENEFGYIQQEAHPGCRGIQINPTHRSAEIGEGDSAQLNASLEKSRFEIHDLMGRLVFAGKALNLSKSNAPQFIVENNLVALPGIYVVSLYHKDNWESWKIYIR